MKRLSFILIQKLKKRFTLLLFTVIGFNGAAQINTPANPTVPFGSNTAYPYGLMPTNLPTSGMYGQATDIADIYIQWKKNYVENCGEDKARIKFDNPSHTVSEGIGYGMLLAAYAADKNLFDRLWAYYKHFQNSHGIMHWKIEGCSVVIGENGATDAEIDAAMALIVADYQWPNSMTPHNYATDAIALINAIKSYEIAPEGTFYNGDTWHPKCRNPSYQAPGYVRAYKAFMSTHGQNQDEFWDKVALGTEKLLVKNANKISGLSTNWCAPQGQPSNRCKGSGTASDKFGYDASRTPWRQGIDLIWWGPKTGQIQSIIDRQSDFWINKGGAQSVQGSDRMNHDGTGSGDHNAAFVGPVGAMALGASNTDAHQKFVNDLYTKNSKTTVATGYFESILQIMGLFVQTGNFWNPYQFE